MNKLYKLIPALFLFLLSARIFAQCNYSILTPPPNICKGSSVVLVASDTVNWTPSSGLSSTHAISVVANPNVTTTYLVWKNGCLSKPTITVTVKPNPTPVINGLGSICTGQNSVFDAGAGDSTYQWSTGAITQSINVSVSGTYSVTVTSFGNCTGSASKTLTVNPPPSPTISGPSGICTGQNATFDAGAGYLSYYWSNNATTQTINISSAGTYTVTVYNASGCSASVSKTLTSGSTLSPVVSGLSSICLGSSTTFLADSGYNSYIWSNGATTQAISVSVAGTYTVTVSGNGSCTGSASKSLTTFTLAPPVITGNTFLCTGDSTQLTASGGLNYLWSTSETSGAILIAPLVSSVYTVTAFDINGCSSTASVLVTVSLPPTVKTTWNDTVCNTAEIVGIQFDSIAGSSSFWYSLNNLNIGFGLTGNDSIPAYVATNLSNQPVTDTIIVFAILSGCAGPNDTLLITVNPTPVITSIPDLIYCNDSLLNNGITFTSSTANTTFSWTSSVDVGFDTSGAGSIPSFVATNNTFYPITSTVIVNAEALGCINSVAEVFIVTVNPTPETNPVSNLVFCSGSLVDSIFFSSNSPDSIIHWTCSNIAIGIGSLSGVNHIPSFVAANTSSSPINALITVYAESNSCTGPVTSFIITIYPAPIVNPLPDIIVCDGDSVQEIGFSSQVSDSSFSWTSSDNIGFGLSGFGNISAFKAINLSGLPIVDTISVTGFANNCEGPVSTFLITINPNPVPVISGQSTICNGSTTVFSADSIYSNYIWSDGSANDSITISSGGLYTVTVTDDAGCTGSTSKTLLVDSVLNPLINGPASICFGTSTVFYTDSVYASYSWSDGSTNYSISVSSGGTYTVTVTNIDGCSGSSTKKLTVDSMLHPVISGSSAICNGSTTVFYTDSIFTNYYWTGGSTNDSLTVSGDGTYTVTVTDANLCTGSASKTLTVYQLPQPVIYGASSICIGKTTAFYTDSIYSNYSWSDGSTNDSIIVSSSGMYTVTVNNADGCSGSSSKSLIVDSVLHPVIYGPSTICNGTSTFFFTDSLYSTYLWTGGSTNDSIAVSTNGTYTVSVTDADLCTGSATKILLVDSILYPVIYGASAICSGTSSVIEADLGFLNYLWSNGATTSGISISVPGTYTVSVTGVGGCTGSASKTIIVNPSPIPIIFGPSTICTGQIVSYQVDTIFEYYIWSTGGSTNAISVSTSGLYIITVTDSNGCIGSASKALIVDSILHPIIYGDTVICYGTSTFFNTDDGFINYNWSDGSTNDSILVSSNGTYTVTVTGAGGCTGIAAASLVVDSIGQISVYGESPVCAGISSIFYADNIYSDYIWSTGSTTNFISIAVAGTYTLTVSDNFGCSASASKSLILNPLPTPAISGPSSICIGQSIVFDAGFGYVNYNWSTLETTQAINVTSAGIYSVIVTDTNGCTGSVSKALLVDSILHPFITGEQLICDGSLKTLTADTGYVNYQWSTGESSASIVVSVAGTYTVTVTGTGGCTGSTSFEITNYALPPPVISGNTSLCIGDSTILTVTGGDAYLWSDGSTSDTLLVNPSVTTTYSVTATTIEGCSSVDSVLVQVNSYPVISNTPDDSVCNGTVMPGITFVSSLPLSTVYWYSLNNQNIGFGLAGYDSIPAYVADNLTSNSVTDTIIVYAVAGGCTGPNDTILLTVKPTPSLYSVADTVFCNHIFLNGGIPFGSPTPNTTFWWTSNFDIGFGTSDTGNIPATILTNNNYYPVTSTIIVSAQSLGCMNDTAAVFTMTVNPTPEVETVNDLTFCAGITSDTIFLSSFSPDSLIHWSSSTGLIGIGSLSGTNFIPPFVATDSSGSAVSAIISVYAEANTCIGDTSTFTVTVNPLPELTGSLTDTICSGVQHLYNANSSPGTIFSWTRDSVNGISNPAASGNSALIVDTLINITSTAITVHYTFSLDFNGCQSKRDYYVVVKPRPEIIFSLTDSVFCAGEIMPQIILNSNISGTVFNWSCSNNIGIVPLSGVGSIPGGTAINTGNDSIFAVITINAVADGCEGNSTSFKIVVRNLPPAPVIEANLLSSDTVCTNSSNISFSITNAIHGSSITYNWQASPSNQISIRDTTHAHTVISFAFQNSGTATIIATAAYPVQQGGCSSADTFNLNVISNGAGSINLRNIFEKNPGHILIYPDNSLDHYQWGYDPIEIDSSQIPPVSVYGQSIPFLNKIYQFCITDSSFLDQNFELDTIHNAFWVMITEGYCRSKVYYNGIYSWREVAPIETIYSTGITISPNPNNGNFDIITYGNIYGNLNLKIYDYLGQVIYQTSFVKTDVELKQQIRLPDFSNGIYLYELNSSDLKKLTGKFLMQH